jgi:NADPH2:quinone reductase
MKAIAIVRPGAPEVLQLTERPDPVAGAGELLIRVTASGVNRPDVLQRKGAYPPPAGASDLPGLEVAGPIVGGDTSAMAAAGFKPGDRVCALVAGGGYAQLCVAPAGQCLPAPNGLSDVEAASLPETFFTVWSNVFDRARLQPGETLLVQGGTSGIGVTAIQLAKAAGATVIVTAGSDEKCQLALEHGAAFAINYQKEDFVERVKQITGGQNLKVVYDSVGKDTFVRSLDCLRPFGLSANFGNASGKVPPIDMGLLAAKGSLYVTRPTLFTHIATREATQAMADDLFGMVGSGAVKIRIDQRYALKDAAQAHRDLEARKTTGCSVLLP